MNANNPREAIGGNSGTKYAEQVVERLESDYAEMENSTVALLDEARPLAAEVTDEDVLEKVSGVVVRMRDFTKRLDETRKVEKEPFFRGGQAVDGFFNTKAERLTKAITVLTKYVNAYQQRKLAEKREADRLAREEADRLAREAREAQERAERIAEEERQRAERARTEHTKAEKSAVAEAAEKEAAEKNVEATLAAKQAQEAYIETLKKPSEQARSRFDEGRLVTMKQVGYVEIIDKDKLDKEKLWPFLKEEDVLKALKAYAKTVSFAKPMDGAIIEMRDDTVIR